MSSTTLVEAIRPPMSAVPPTATDLMPRNELTRCANRVLTHRSKKAGYSIIALARAARATRAPCYLAPMIGSAAVVREWVGFWLQYTVSLEAFCLIFWKSIIGASSSSR
jgi:hypothetical protein